MPRTAPASPLAFHELFFDVPLSKGAPEERGREMWDCLGASQTDDGYSLVYPFTPYLSANAREIRPPKTGGQC